jgi:hypothetical protein
MKIIGYWIRSLLDSEYPPPQELVSVYGVADKSAIAEYLDSGREFADYRGVSWCRFGCDFPMGSRELTDGQWLWPEGLSHYVRDHDVRLPDEFVACTSPRYSSFQREAYDQIGGPDDAYWIAWCAQVRSNSLRANLSLAREQAESEVAQIATTRIEELEKLEGVSDSVCKWAGCSNFTLSGRALCASCLVKADFVPHITKPYTRLLRHVLCR